MSALDVTLQLERRHVLSVAVLAGRVALPALAVLLFQLQVVFQMVHKPVREGRRNVTVKYNVRHLIVTQVAETADYYWDW